MITESIMSKSKYAGILLQHSNNLYPPPPPSCDKQIQCWPTVDRKHNLHHKELLEQVEDEDMIFFFCCLIVHANCGLFCLYYVISKQCLNLFFNGYNHKRVNMNTEQ